jgi:hypothetical protein
MKALDYAILKRVFEVILAKLNRAVRRTLKMLKRFYPLIQRRLQSKKHVYLGRFIMAIALALSYTLASLMIRACPFKSLKRLAQA